MLPLASVAVCRSSEKWRMCAVSCGISGRTIRGRVTGLISSRVNYPLTMGESKQQEVPVIRPGGDMKESSGMPPSNFVETVQKN